jgi:hypothetical protein
MCNIYVFEGKVVKYANTIATSDRYIIYPPREYQFEVATSDYTSELKADHIDVLGFRARGDHDISLLSQLLENPWFLKL